MMAFAPSTFLGAASVERGLPTHAAVAPSRAPRMAVSSSGASKIWQTFMTTTKARSNPYFKEYALDAADSFAAVVDARNEAHARVDGYIAERARRQYIITSNASGVYAVSCTEGASKFSAEDSRVAALSARFRAAQSSDIARYADLYETRRRATVLARNCSYEEGLVRRFERAAAAVVTGNSEKNLACARYSDPQSLAEKYMMESVQRAASARATAGGVYDVMCNDGAFRGAAEDKRVRCLSVQYRSKQRSPLAKEQAKYTIPAFARENYLKEGNYEEGLFEKFPATASAMRPESARY